jgi:hypothetical protein
MQWAFSAIEDEDLLKEANTLRVIFFAKAGFLLKTTA